MTGSNNSIGKTIDEATDAEIARRMISLMTPTNTPVDLCVERRFVGSKRIGRGLPFGLGVSDKGEPILEKLALIRVQPNEHIEIAKKILLKKFYKTIAIGVIASIVVGTISSIIFQRFYHVRTSLPLQVSVPCKIHEISTKGIACSIGNQKINVMVNDFFPGTSLKLSEVFRDKSGFAVTTKEQQTIFFVVNDNLSLKGNTK